MKLLNTFTTFNLIILVVMTILYFYQIVYIGIGLKKKNAASPEPARTMHHYAVFISARNESHVKAELLDSLQKQNYPHDLLDVFVLADNCTDNTAEISRQHGAYVYERFDQKQVGKGYALDYLYHHVIKDHGHQAYEGFFVFDADNIVDPEFVRSMNDTFDTGKYEAVTCYRNSKNFATNWLSAAYSIWFLREARFVNYPRMLLGTSCMISGTGFLVSSKLMEENHGWPYHLLTEDIQFSVNCAISGHMIGYCDQAVVYDEQPTTFMQSYKQRLRWSKGFYQIDSRYIFPLMKGMTQKNRAMSCYDVLMTVAPAMLLTLAAIGINVWALLAATSMPHYIRVLFQQEASEYLLWSAIFYYLGMVMLASLTVFSEWKRIPCTSWQKIKYIWIFPLFILSYIPITLQALFTKVKWTPIEHYTCAQLSMAQDHHHHDN